MVEIKTVELKYPHQDIEDIDRFSWFSSDVSDFAAAPSRLHGYTIHQSAVSRLWILSCVERGVLARQVHEPVCFSIGGICPLLINLADRKTHRCSKHQKIRIPPNYLPIMEQSFSITLTFLCLERVRPAKELSYTSRKAEDDLHKRLCLCVYCPWDYLSFSSLHAGTVFADF